MSLANYRIVQKPFNLDSNERLRPGQVVDVSEWRNIGGLESGRYVRRPVTEEDYQLINKSIDGADEQSAPKRGRPPKNGGEE